MDNKAVLGIDIGGSGIKGAPVDLVKGDFAADRLRIDTPVPSTPKAVAGVVKQIVDHFADQIDPGMPVGITVPAPVVHGVVPSMANLDASWAGTNVDELFSRALDRPVHVYNDADAAGVAEAHYGAAAGNAGLVLMTTLGTGIGTALIHRGILIPNSELGHVELDGKDAEKRAAASVKEKKGLSYKEWAQRLQEYYSHIESLLFPDLIVVGGGVSKDAEKFLPLLKLRAPIVAATLQNRAGIIGAAWLAAESVEVDKDQQTIPAEETGSAPASKDVEKRVSSAVSARDRAGKTVSTKEPTAGRTVATRSAPTAKGVAKQEPRGGRTVATNDAPTPTAVEKPRRSGKTVAKKK